MNDKNQLTIEGTITTAPALKNPTPASSVCNCILVNKEYYKHKQTLHCNDSFSKLEFWNNLATLAHKTLKVGTKILIQKAQVKQNRWLDQTGIQRKEIVIKVSKFTQLNKESK